MKGANHDKPVILCCDDDKAIQDVCHRVLKGRYDVVGVQSGLEVLPACRKKRPSLILLDISIPPPNGLIVLGMLRMDPDLHSIPVVMLTADGRVKTVQKALEKGAMGFILKPVQPTGLFAKVSRYMEDAAAAARLRESEQEQIFAASVAMPAERQGVSATPPASTADIVPEILESIQAMEEQLSGEDPMQDDALPDAFQMCLDYFLKLLPAGSGALFVNDYPGDTFRLGASTGLSNETILEFYRKNLHEIVNALHLAKKDVVRFLSCGEREPWTTVRLRVRGRSAGFFLIPTPEETWTSTLARLRDTGLFLKMAGFQIHMWQLVASARRGMIGIARAFGASLDAKDPYTQGHSERVTLYALALNSMAFRHLQEYHIPTAELRLAGLLHDVGKIGIHDSILGKTEKLTPEEFEKMKDHAVLGRRMLATVPELRLAMDGMAHHERYDGQGYPEHLASEEIPLVGRFLAVADTFDAMTSSRPYRKGLDPEVALAEIRKNSGTQFDPLVVELFEHAYTEGLFASIHRMNFPVEGETAESLAAETAAASTDPEREKLFEKLFAHFDTINLVSPSSQHVLGMLDDPLITIEKVARRIESDTALTTRVLQVANSSFYGFSRKIASVEQGIIVLGIRQLKNLLYAISLRDLHAAHGLKAELRPFWKHAFSVGIVARVIAQHMERRQLPESAFLAGLMHDIGKVVLLLLHPDRYARVTRRVEADGMTFRRAEKEEFGLSHDESASFIVSHWNLPPFLLDPILHHHEDRLDPDRHQLACIVKAADALSYRMAPGGFSVPVLDAADLELLLESLAPSLLPVDRLERFASETLQSYEDVFPELDRAR